MLVWSGEANESFCRFCARIPLSVGFVGDLEHTGVVVQID